MRVARAAAKQSTTEKLSDTTKARAAMDPRPPLETPVTDAASDSSQGDSASVGRVAVERLFTDMAPSACSAPNDSARHTHARRDSACLTFSWLHFYLIFKRTMKAIWKISATIEINVTCIPGNGEEVLTRRCARTPHKLV